MRNRFKENYIIRLLFSLQGNPRWCLWLEPLWGIPFNLYMPFVTLYMTSIGITLAQIGYITSITMVSQVIFAVLSGVLTDKLGRRKCTIIFDVLSWSIPELLWMFSQNFHWFAVAACFNGAWRVTENSWYLLMIEDADKEHVVGMNSITQFMGLLAAFIAPLGKFAVDRFGITMTMRFMYGLAFVGMTTKFIVLYIKSTETQAGLKRLKATENRSILSMLWECKDVYVRVIREKRMALTLGLIAVYMLITTLNGNYWALYLRDRLYINDGDVSLFVTLRSVVQLLSILVLVPKVRATRPRRPLLYSYACFAAAQVLLLCNHGGALRVPVLVLSVALEAIAISVLGPVNSSMLYINADEEERARVIGMVYATVALIVAVFPTLIGLLAQVSIRIPFFINIALLGVAAFLSVLITRAAAEAE